MSNLDQFLNPSPKNRPVKVVDIAERAIDAKRTDPYSAPTYDGFQNAFRAKYGKMPRAPEIEHYYERHPEVWKDRHGGGSKR
ncbi:MAG: hypothetical protein SA339_08400 [Methanomassiliicoccus sp.]|nr:hypothetical protein [Methanomassiliicoccus sp.]